MTNHTRSASLLLFVAVAATSVFASCGGADDAEPTNTVPSALGTKASSETPASTPAPTGTVVGTPSQRPVTNGYRAVAVLPSINLDRMVGLLPIPGDATHALVLTQQEGIVYRASLNSDDEPAVFLDLSDKLIDSPGNEEGLLGLAFAPDYTTSRRLFVYYSVGNPRRTVVERYTAGEESADPSSAQRILEVSQPFPNHKGGSMVFGPDGMLYIGLGDGGSAGDPMGNGQRVDTLLGKILRIDVSGDRYEIPPDNPFVGQGRGEIWSYGMRNPWRITFDRETGNLWVGDVGQNTWEEIDLITRGGNYGWNITEGPDCYGKSSCDRTDLIPPRAFYGRDDGCSVTGGYVYRGNAMPELRGWYLFSDYCSGKVWALDTRSDSSKPVLLINGGDSVSTFAEFPDGELYLVTFARQIERIERAD